MTISIADDERWQKSLQRAIDEGLEAAPISPTEWRVSSSDGTKYYTVNVKGNASLCSCPSTHGYCKHRALVLHKLGKFGDEGPEIIPPSPFDPTEDEMRAWFGSD